MSSLYRRPDSPNYYISYNYHGTRHRLATGTSKKQQALIIKTRLDQDLLSGKFNLSAFMGHSAVTLDDFLQQAIGYARINKSPRTAEREAYIMENFKNFAGADLQLDRINQEMIERYKIYLLQERKFKASGVNIELRHLSAVFSLAIKYKYLSVNPFKGVNKLPVPRKLPRYLTPEQAKTLLDHLHERPLYLPVAIALGTGARISEICQLQWRNIDFKHNQVIVDGKGSKERMVPVPEYLVWILKDTPCGSADEYVLGEWRDRKIISKRFGEVITKLNMQPFMFHNLRDTYASWLVQDGVPLKVIQELLGHSSIQTTMIYAHLADDSKQLAVRVINSRMKL